MRLVGIDYLTSGDVLDAPIYNQRGKIVINKGITLTDALIDRLRKIGVTKAYVVDVRFDDVEIIQPLNFETRNKIEAVIKENYVSFHKHEFVDEYLIKETAKEIVNYVREYREKGASMMSMAVSDEYIIKHSLNVSILSAFLGNSMSFNYSQLCDLVAGAIVHDLGRENKREENEEHVKKGFEVMRKCRALSLLSSIVCYEHHENYDGTGYPRGLKGESIPIFSRVIRVADFYDIILNGCDKDNIPIMPHQAFEGIMAVSGKILDPSIVQKFKDTIIFYPNGCTVLLSNGQKGVVIKQNMGIPQRPIVRVFDDKRILGDVDLLSNFTVFIEDVLVF